MKKIYKTIKAFTVLMSLATFSAKAQSYCIPAVSSTADDEIAYVSFATMSNTTQCNVTAPGPGSSGSMYSNFTGSSGIPNVVGSVPAPVVIQGFNYPLSVGLTMCNTGVYSGIIGVFIDYNQDGLFTGTGELVWTSTYGAGALSPAFNIFSAPAGITIPATALTGLTRMRVWESETSTMGGPCGSITWGEVEDYVINIIAPTPCSTAPIANSVVGPTAAICPNANAPMYLANSNTVTGITTLWYSSTTSSVGPFTAIPNATLTSYSAPNVTVATWYTAVLTCTNTAQSMTAVVNQVSVQPVTISTVPYYESFEGIQGANKLPNCSWSASNLPANCNTSNVASTLGRTARTGNAYASFYYNPAGTRYFYTNGIQLDAGITYSASLWFQTEYYGYNNWTDLSILYGTTQTATGQVTIATTAGPAISNVYKSLSNTFTVPTSGIYYIAVRGTGNTSSSAQYLTWDDLRITIPCNAGSPNTPTISLSANNTTICANDAVGLTAGGADTYTWSNGANGSSISDTPFNNVVYTVVGTNTLTGCTNTVSQAITVNPAPSIYVIANKATVCAGSPANITAFGATSYTWSNGNNNNIITVSPTANTNYTVLGTNAQGCTGFAVQSISVTPLPTVTASSSLPNEMCVKETAVLTAAGSPAISYQWLSNTSSFIMTGNPISVSPNQTTTYTLTATDVNGCSKSTTFVQNVNDCVGLNEIAQAGNAVKVYPNPTVGEFTIELSNATAKTLEVVDLSGRVVYTGAVTSDKVKVNLVNAANGIYYVKIKSNSTTEVVKVVKQ